MGLSRSFSLAAAFAAFLALAAAPAPAPAQVRTLVVAASGTPEGELRMIVDRRGLAPYFGGAVHGSPRAKADILGGLMQGWGLVPQQVLMIGDASTDHEAARQCGTQFVARTVPSTAREWQDKTSWCVPDLQPLARAFLA